MGLRSLSAQTTGKLDVFGLDGDTLGVNGSQVGAAGRGRVSTVHVTRGWDDSLLEEGDEVGLGRLLEGSDSGGLESEVGLEVLGDLTDETLEAGGGRRVSSRDHNKGRGGRWDSRELPDEELGTLLVTPDLTESDGSRPVPVGLLDTTGGGGRLAGSLSSKLLPGRLSSGRLSCGLLGE
jgi:hypothetical protein